MSLGKDSIQKRVAKPAQAPEKAATAAVAKKAATTKSAPKQAAAKAAPVKTAVVGKIAPEVVDPDDIETLEDLIVAAVNEGLNKVASESEAEMSKITGGMGLPGMF